MESKLPSQGHRVYKWQSWDLNPGSLAQALNGSWVAAHAHVHPFPGIMRLPSPQSPFIPSPVTPYSAIAFHSSPSVDSEKNQGSPLKQSQAQK